MKKMKMRRLHPLPRRRLNRAGLRLHELLGLVRSLKMTAMKRRTCSKIWNKCDCLLLVIIRVDVTIFLGPTEQTLSSTKRLKEKDRGGGREGGERGGGRG